jgi:hypothetical protein
MLDDRRAVGRLVEEDLLVGDGVVCSGVTEGRGQDCDGASRGGGRGVRTVAIADGARELGERLGVREAVGVLDGLRIVVTVAAAAVLAHVAHRLVRV